MLYGIYCVLNELRGDRKRKEDSRNENPQCSTPNRAVLEPILADLDRLWEMRHWIPDPGEPIICKTNITGLVKQ